MNLKKIALSLATVTLCGASAFATASPLTAPSISPNSGTETSGQIVTITAVPQTIDTLASGCFYTTNGTAPTTASASCGTPGSPVTVTLSDLVTGSTDGTSNKVTIEAAQLFTVTLTTAQKAEYANSVVTKASYVVDSQVGPPTLFPASSKGPESVTITDSWTDKVACTTGTAGCVAGFKTILPTIYYATSTDETAPAVACGTATTTTVPGWTKYVAKSVIVANQADTTIYTCAIATGYTPSGTTSGLYDDGTGQTIGFVVGSGSSAQTVELALAFDGINGDGNGGACATSGNGGHHFTYGTASGIGAGAADNRSGVTPTDIAGSTLILVWDNSNDTTDANVNNSAMYPAPAPPTKICAYLQTDSGLGVKAFMNSNLTTAGEALELTVAPDHPYTIGNKVNFWNTADNSGATPDENMIPLDVYNAIQGHAFNYAGTDIRPEDAYFATKRALTGLNANRTGLGYGPGPVGSPILSDASSSFNVASFAFLPGQADPITTSPQTPYTTVALGAAPVLVAVNKSVPSSTDTNFHFGNAEVTNISRFTLAGYLNGSVTGTGALATVPSTTLVSSPVHVWLREPLSGTYNTMEFNVPNSKEIGTSQEFGVLPAFTGSCTGAKGHVSVCISNLASTSKDHDPAGNIGNPLYIEVQPGVASWLGNTIGGTLTTPGTMIGVLGATRQRAIGTGEMVTQIGMAASSALATANATVYPNGYNDALGYAFWGYGNFTGGNNAGNEKYLTVDGVDPIYSSYSTGAFPACSSTSGVYSCPTLTFPNVENGSYPIWSMLRAVVPAEGSPQYKTLDMALINSLFASIQTSSEKAFDFVPVANMQVLRSHFIPTGILPTGVVATNPLVAPVDGYSTSTPLTAGGTISAATENGGDVGGAVYTIQADIDHLAQYGTEILNVKQ